MENGGGIGPILGAELGQSCTHTQIQKQTVVYEEITSNLNWALKPQCLKPPNNLDIQKHSYLKT